MIFVSFINLYAKQKFKEDVQVPVKSQDPLNTLNKGNKNFNNMHNMCRYTFTLLCRCTSNLRQINNKMTSLPSSS